MYVHGKVAPGVIRPFYEAWATFSSCKPFVTERQLELTFQYAKNLKNAHMAMGGQWVGHSGQRAAGGHSSRYNERCLGYGLSYEQ